MNNTNHHQQHPTYTLLILAGGAGRRMEGRDKGLQQWRGKPLVAHVVNAVPEARHRLISCNRNFSRYARYGETVADTLPDYQGPLAGILMGLQRAQEEFVLVLPCDCPQPPQDLYQRLYAALQDRKASISYAWDGSREQYLFALIHRTVATTLLGYLGSGERSVHGWYRQQQATQVDFSDQPQSFLNFNSLEALQEK